MQTNNSISLSIRQQQCASFLLQGMTAKEIARELNLSKRTIEHYIENLRKKLSCRNKSQLIIHLYLSHLRMRSDNNQIARS